jgi:hypothetical protein
VAPIRHTRVASRVLSLIAIAIAAGIAAPVAVTVPAVSTLGVLALSLLASRRPTAIRWALLALIAALAFARLNALTWLAAPALVACSELAFAAAEMRAAPIEDARLLGERIGAATTVTIAATIVTALVAVLVSAPLPGGAVVTAAGFAAAAAACVLIGVRDVR